VETPNPQITPVLPDPTGLLFDSDSAPLPTEREGVPSEWAANRKGLLKWLGGALVVILALTGLVAGVRSLRHPKAVLTGSLDVQTNPSGASVLLNGELKGQSPLRVESLAPGSYEIRIERDGFKPNAQTLQLDSGNPIRISVLMEPLAPPQPEEISLPEKASALLELGKLVESSQTCDAILAADAQNDFALGLKVKIRRSLLKQSNQHMQKGRWEDARLTLNNLLMISPRDVEALAALKVVKAKVKKTPVAAESKDELLRTKVQQMREGLSAAAGSGNYFPPKAGNAMDLATQLNQLSPDDALVKEKLDQIYRDLLGQMQRKIQARDFENARSIGQKLQIYFSERAEFRNLRDTLKAEETQTQEIRNTALQKAEASLAAGRFILPANDNAVLYCNRVLAVDPVNPKAQAVKREGLGQASAQAKEWVQNGKYDEARAVYLALLGLSQSEPSSPLNAKELKTEADKLEFVMFTVLHNHTLGDCTGRLKTNAYIMAFIPNGDSKCAFSQKLSDIVQLEPGDKLKIQFKTKTYRFEASSASSKEDNRDKVNAMFQKLKQLMAKRA